MWDWLLKHHEELRNFALTLGVFGAGVGLWLAYLRTQTDRKRQVSDSFAKAVELLGHEKRAIRLGAVYALERIMRENRDLHWQIVETLCGFVREQSALENRALAKATAEGDGEASSNPVIAMIGDDPVNADKAWEEVAAALQVIARRNWRRVGRRIWARGLWRRLKLGKRSAARPWHGRFWRPDESLVLDLSGARAEHDADARSRFCGSAT